MTGAPRPGGAADQEHSQVPAVGLVLLTRRGEVVSGATPTCHEKSTCMAVLPAARIALSPREARMLSSSKHLEFLGEWVLRG
jgi:hypothetical protein